MEFDCNDEESICSDNEEYEFLNQQDINCSENDNECCYADSDSYYTNETDSDSENELINKEDNNEYIFSGSNIKVDDFSLSFLVLCKKLNINTTAKTILLNYIATILPFNNKIPPSYRKLIKNISINSVKRTKLCDLCYNETCSCASEKKYPFLNLTSLIKYDQL